MLSNRLRKAFTLVELLVVISIIALLISALLPALNKAKQQANLVQCGSNLRQMASALNIYSAENHGWLPYGYAQAFRASPTDFGHGWWNTVTWQWQDSLSLLSNNRSQAQGGTWNNNASSWNSKNEQNMAYDFLGIFHDTDTPGLPYPPRVSDYTANIRVLPDDTSVDAADPTAHHVYPLRQQGSISHPAEVMMIWCGGDNVSDGQTNMGADALDWQLDASGATNGGWGYGSCFPETNSTYGGWNNPIAIGNDGFHYSGYPAGSPRIPTVNSLRAENIDRLNTVWSFNSAIMRFRHMGNNAANFLFADGHVEERMLGDVRAKDISLNPLSTFGVAPAGWTLPQ